MTKELTEQWREGGIQETYYYVKCPWSDGEVDIRYVHNGVDDWKEIIAPVPSYDEWQALEYNCEFTHTRLKGAYQKIEKLEKKLDIAVNVLEYYAQCKHINLDLVTIRDDCAKFEVFEDGEHARKALEEIDLVGTSVSLADNKIQANTLADNKLKAKEKV